MIPWGVVVSAALAMTSSVTIVSGWSRSRIFSFSDAFLIRFSVAYTSLMYCGGVSEQSLVPSITNRPVSRRTFAFFCNSTSFRIRGFDPEEIISGIPVLSCNRVGAVSSAPAGAGLSQGGKIISPPFSSYQFRINFVSNEKRTSHARPLAVFLDDTVHGYGKGICSVRV